ncbi:MAG: hypothetical protein ACKO0M_18980 [Cyanobium sp.]
MPPPTPRALAGLIAGGLLIAGLPVLAALPASATSIEDIRQLENLINASGTDTIVSVDCPPNHAGYYENDGRNIDRLVICRRNVDMGDVEAVWEVMAHESTHIMQACTGTTALADEQMPRTYRELQTIAPHYAKLISSAYSTATPRLETEAFWMELQTPPVVMELFRRNCAAFLRPGGAPPRRQPPALPLSPSGH